MWCIGGATELPVCSKEGRHHFTLGLPADCPLPGPYGDLDHPRKHCNSSCSLTCLLLVTLPETNRSRRRNWPPPFPHVVLPDLSPGPPFQICSWIPHCLCHTSFQTQQRGDLLPFWSCLWLLWWDGLSPELLPWQWHSICCPGWLQHPCREAALTWIHQLLHIWPYTLPLSTDPPSREPTRYCLHKSALSVTLLTASDYHNVTFSLPLKFTTSLTPKTSHGHHLPQSEIPLSLCSLLYCSFVITIYRPVFSIVYWGRLLHSAILPLLFRQSLSTLLPTGTILSGCLNLCEPIDRCYESQRENGENHIILMTFPITTTLSLTRPQRYQQSNLPSTCQRSTPLPPNPGNSSLQLTLLRKQKQINSSFTPVPIQKAPSPDRQLHCP